MDSDDDFSLISLKQCSRFEPAKKSKANGSNQKGFNLFESLISTNFIDKCPFDLEPYRENVADYQNEGIELLKVEEMVPKTQVQEKKKLNVSPIIKIKKLQQEQFSISEQISQVSNTKYALNKRKQKMANRSVAGSTNNMLTIFKSLIRGYLKRENFREQNQFFQKGYVNMKRLHELVTGPQLGQILGKMIDEKYLQRALVSSSISLPHKILYMKKLKIISKWKNEP